MRIFWIGLVVGQTPSLWVIRLCVKRTFIEHSRRKKTQMQRLKE